MSDVQSTPEWRAADALAQAMFAQRFPDALWRGRKTNRAYWRRLAKGELHRAARQQSPENKEPGT